MAKDLVARKSGIWSIIGMLPDVCKTPIGSAVVPIPYPVIISLSTSQKISGDVRANDDNVLTLNKSFTSTTIGDQPGVCGGIKSGTVGGKCHLDQHSKSVRANKRYIVRHGDKAWMNGR